MNQLKMRSPDLAAANIAKLAELFPNCEAEEGMFRQRQRENQRRAGVQTALAGH